MSDQPAVIAFGDLVPRIGRDVFVAEGARLVGDVRLGDRSSVTRDKFYAENFQRVFAPVV